MKRARWILVALVLVLAAGALWLVLRAPAGARGGGRGRTVEPVRSAERGGPAAELETAEDTTQRADVPTIAAEGARAPVAGEKAPSAPAVAPQQYWEVEVVRADTLAAVADAAVWVRAGENADPLALPPLVEAEASLRTDAAGRVKVPASAEQRVVAACAGALAGVARAPELPGSEVLRVELHPDFDVPVEVRHAGGAPAPDVLVALGVPPAPRWKAVERETDADGRITFAHVGLKMALERESAGEVRVARPLDAPLVQALDVRRPPRAPVVFVLPPCATVDVRVRGADGQPVADGTRLGLAHLAPGTERDVSPFAHGEREYLEAETSAGVARFACVELGGELELLVYSEGWSVLTRAFRPAPLRPDAREEHVLDVGLSHAVLVWRVLDDSGAVLADERLGLRFLHRSGWSHADRNSEQRTDAEGRLRVELVDAFREGDQRQLTVEAREGALGALVDLARSFDPGEHFQGDLRLAAPPLLAAGRVTDGAGAGLTAGIGLHYPVLENDGRTIWYWQEWSRAYASAADGSFEVRAFLDVPELRLQAQKGELRSDLVAVARGERGVELRLLRAGWIEGSVRLDEGVPLAGITLDLRPGGARENVPGRQSMQPAPDGRFRFVDLAPGIYDLALDVQGQELVLVEGLVVPPGEACRDPRLAFDLRGQLHWMRFVLVPPAPAGPLDGSLQYWPSGTEGQARRYHWFQGSPVDLLALHERIDLLLTVPGYRPVRLEGVSDGQEILLQPALTARLQLPPGVRLPEPPLYVKATLVHEGVEEGLDFAGAAFDERREITCKAPGPGRLLVRWIAEKRGSSGASATTLDGLPPQYVELMEGAGEPLFVLTIDDAALHAALAQSGL